MNTLVNGLSSRGNALYNLYKKGLIKDKGLRKAVEDGQITEQEYFIITGKEYGGEQ